MRASRPSRTKPHNAVNPRFQLLALRLRTCPSVAVGTFRGLFPGPCPATAGCRTRSYWLYVTLHPQVSPLFPLCPGVLAPWPRIYLPWAKSLEKSTSQCYRGHLVSDKFYHLSRCFFRHTTSNSEPPPSRDPCACDALGTITSVTVSHFVITIALSGSAP